MERRCGAACFWGLHREQRPEGNFANQFLSEAVCGTFSNCRCYTLWIFHVMLETPASRAEEEALGLAEAYLVDVSPEDIVNWKYDAQVAWNGRNPERAT